MDWEGLKQKLIEFIKNNLVVVILCLAGFIFLAYGLISFLGASSSGSDQVMIDSQETAKTEAKISVDIEGAVIKPGVYSLSTSSRIQDGLIAAGGLDASADRDWLSKNLNLASKLIDGAKIYIPKTGEQVQQQQSSNLGSNVQVLVNINTADEALLDTLPGVGKVTAEKIIANRPYSTLDDLVLRKVLGASTFSKIKDKISTN